MSVIGAAHIPPHEGAPSLELVGFSKRFGSLAALDDVSVKVNAGAFHALLGENGAGKSTLVKCAMGYYPGRLGTDPAERA
jgi:ABC-type sugar transport system ATPase subunit